MDRATLLAMVTDTAHRPDLVTQAPDFLRQAESMIAREVRSVEQITLGSLTDTSRVTVGKPSFNLPSNFLLARSIWLGDVELRNTSLSELRRVDVSIDVQWYSIRGSVIEFRGNPATTDTFDLDYFSRMAALTAPADTNALLNNHEELYLSGSLFFLYRYTQDPDLAQAFFQSFGVARDALNAAAANQIGGQAMAPAYNFSPQGSY
jgi:hypothetical protein